MQPNFEEKLFMSVYYQTGIFSYGLSMHDSEQKSELGVYTRVSHFIDWIQEKLTNRETGHYLNVF